MMNKTLSILAFMFLILGAMSAHAAPLSLYRVVSEEKTEGAVTMKIYQVTEQIELTPTGEGRYATPESIEIEAGSLWVLASDYPRLYSMTSDNKLNLAELPHIEMLQEGGEMSVYTASDRNDGKRSVVYQIADAAKGTMIFNMPDESTAGYTLAKSLYFRYMEEGNWGPNAKRHFEIKTSTLPIEMRTLDGINYMIDRIEIPKDELFNIGTITDYKPLHKESEIIEVCNNTECSLTMDNVAKATAQMIGSVKVVRDGDTYKTTLEPLPYAPVFMHITKAKTSGNNLTQATKSYLEFSINEFKEQYDYEYFLNVPNVTTDEGIEFTYKLPKIGETISTNSHAQKVKSSQFAVEGKNDRPGEEITFEYAKSSGKHITFPDGNFHGKIYLSPAKNEDGSVAENKWVMKFVISQSAEDIMNEFAAESDETGMLDKELNGDKPLKYDWKPVLHDNEARKDTDKLSIPKKGGGSIDHDLVYMERRRSLTGVDCNINRLANGSLASVVNVQDHFDKMMGDDLNEAAEFVSVANVKLAAAPLVSVRDEKHYYARGTEAGFNLSSGSGTSVLSLSLIEMLSIGFYRDGELLTVVPVAGENGTGLDLSLITIDSGRGSYDLKAKSPVVFDEVCLYTAGGLKLEVGNGLKINYAFVGKEQGEVTLGSNGRKAYNEKMKTAGKDYELYVLSYQTVAHPSGKEVHDGDNVKSAFIGDEKDSENLTNLGSLFTLGMGWAEVKLDAKGKDAPGDDRQLFPKGSRVNFKIKGTKVLNLGLGTGNTITFFTRNNVVRDEDGNITKIGWDSKKIVLSATVLQLDVAKTGEQIVSMIAPCDFSGVRLDINDGLVNLGGTNVYYASITPPVEVPHKCELGIPSKIILDKKLIKYYKAGDEGNSISTSRYEKISEYKPVWNEEVAKELEWKLISAPEGSKAILAEDGTLTDSDDENNSVLRDGEYVLTYKVPADKEGGNDHANCIETVTYVVSHNRDVNILESDAEEIRNIIGNGIILQNEKGKAKEYQVTLNTHDVTTGQLIAIDKVLQAPDSILDGKLSTYAKAQKGIELAQNNILIGVKHAKGKCFGTTENKFTTKPLRIGFIIEETESFAGINALNFLQIRTYCDDGKDTYRYLIDENASVGVELIGNKPVTKKRYSILVPAGEHEFNEFSLWNCGVANIQLNEVRIYGAFVEEVDPENVNENWAVGDRHDLIYKDATAIPLKAGVVEAANVLQNIDFMIDDDLNTAFELGNAANVGAGQVFRIELGREVSEKEKIGIIMDNSVEVADVTAGEWMKVRLYGPEETSSDTLGTLFAESPRRAKSSTVAHTEVTDWRVLGAEVGGYGDKKAIYFVPKKKTSAMEIEIGKILALGNNNGIYGITVAPTPDYNVEYRDDVETGVETVSNDKNTCELLVDESGNALIVTPGIIKDVRVYSIDGKRLPCHAAVSGQRADVQLEPGISIINVYMADGSMRVMKVIR
ncbi:MAG: hypothetical protein NC204_03650 [Candidatus Amulumruptor caecigallinarius]|nr:hypothetical protein [Candidatus Amulumruptor caecigallinarius]